MDQAIDAELPRWDTTNIYSARRRRLPRRGGRLAHAARRAGGAVRSRRHSPPRNCRTRRRAGGDVARGAEQLERLARLSGTLQSFVYAFFSTDSYNTVAAREMSKLELLGVRAAEARRAAAGWIGSLAPRLDALIAARIRCWPSHAVLSAPQRRRRSRYLMSEELEKLAAELCVDAGGAFGKLQGKRHQPTQGAVGAPRPDARTADHDGPQFCVRSPIRAVRERAYHAETRPAGNRFARRWPPA